MKIHRINPLTKLPIIVDLDITVEQILDYSDGKLIQNVWSNMSTDEREFYLSGVPMGLFEIQFERHFVEICFAKGFRWELYIANSLLSLDETKLNIFCYQYENDEFVNFSRLDFVINDENKFIIYGDIFKFAEQLNTDEKLIEFCLEFQKTKAERELKYSFNDIIYWRNKINFFDCLFIYIFMDIYYITN